ncbi:MAG: hypothetical protein C3F13_18085 [Anaerolineales bacterium]|nr:hypothetical protein [Anaerolineae bacterium]PWB49748.1 MAG: hypothetical protein C3F13_18085 [Anaerolineales bacterium]
MNQYTFGVDVSHWEGMIDWSIASQYIPFAYYKCTEGLNFVDDLFKSNKQGCQEAGIPHSCYHYYKPSADPEEQAEVFYQASGGDYPVLILDLEEAPKKSKSEYMKDIRAFILYLHARLHGPNVAIYTSAGFWNEHVTSPAPDWAFTTDLIVAHYTTARSPSIPIGFNNFKIWQFTDRFWFPGCSETADGNWFNGNLKAMRQWFGNYRPLDPPQPRLRLRSQFNALHIRARPDMKAAEIGHLNRGEIVECVELGGPDCWVKHRRGWTAIERNGYRYMEVLNER